MIKKCANFARVYCFESLLETYRYGMSIYDERVGLVMEHANST
jgi:hypothetical protein